MRFLFSIAVLFSVTAAGAAASIPTPDAHCLDSAVRILQDKLFAATGEEFVVQPRSKPLAVRAPSGASAVLRSVWVDDRLDGHRTEIFVWSVASGSVIIPMREVGIRQCRWIGPQS